MELAVGTRRVDLATGVVVIGAGPMAGPDADAMLEGCGRDLGLPAAVRLTDVPPCPPDRSMVVVLTHVGRCGPDPVEEVRGRLHEQALVAVDRGIPPDQLVLDPGIDTKPPEQAIELLRGTARIAEARYPIAVAALGLAFTDLGTGIGLLTVAIISGCRVVLADDTRVARRVADVIAAVVSSP